jgi:DNA mismatch repair protein MutS
MRSQYLALKKQYPDIILLFRLGDFYETFDDDAKIVSAVCDVVLTSRPVGADERVPLAGVPYHAVDGYIARLINAGYKVAIAEQIGNEPPKGEKLVPRVVRRVVTPGTLVEPNLLPEKRDNYIAALVLDLPPQPPSLRGKGEDLIPSASAPPSPSTGSGQALVGKGAGGSGRAGLAYADITTGEFATTEITNGADVQHRVAEELGRLAPAELLYPAKDPRWAGRAEAGGQESEGRSQGAAHADIYSAIRNLQSVIHITPYASWRFEETTARQTLLDHFRVASLAGYGCDDKPLAVRAAGALLQYLAETQKDNVAQVVGLRTYSISEYMLLDEATRRNLELTESIRGGTTQGSLLGVLDATLTPMGGRLLRRWLNQPLLDVAALNKRLDAVTAWHTDAPLRAGLRQSLRGLGDLERWVNRCVQGIALPRDLVGIREALARVEKIRGQEGGRAGEQGSGGAGGQEAGGRKQESGGRSQESGGSFQLPATSFQHLDPCSDISSLLAAAIADEPPATLASTGVIRPGFSAELDGIHVAIRDAKEWIANLETVERQRTGIKSLKVGYNKVFGYYIEVTTANAGLVPADYIRKQTLVNAERYITPELKEYESLVLNAEERILELEGQLYRQVLAQIAAAAPRLLATARALAELDVYASLAEVAEANRYVRPVLTDDRVIDIKAGRHPVVEKALSGEPFTPNDAYLSPEQAIVILTGPNMSGKSCFLRQTALIVLLAQIGSYVPADSARIGLVDRIFTRIGASDEIARGQSTFMVEMIETSNILHHATNRSLR